MSGSSEILAAIRDMQTHFEGQFHATNKAIQELHKSTDLWFDALQAGPLPARSGSHGSFQRPPPPAEAPSPASSPAFRSDGSSSVPQRRRGLHLLSVDVTSAAASISFSAAPPPSAPPPSAGVSPPSPPSSSASPSPSAVAFPPSVADSPLPLGSGAMLNRAGFAAAVVGQFAAPPPFLSSDDTTTLYQTTGNADGKLGFVNIPGSPLPPPPEGTPPPILQFGTQPPPPPPQAHSTRPNPSDTKAQTFLNLVSTPLTQPNNKFKDDAAVASRRGVIFSLYALEEVYKDILESPP